MLGPTSLDDIPDGHRWYADLRFIIPISKGVMLHHAPIDGMLTEHDTLAFGETLAQKFRRPALHAALSEDVPQALETFVRDNGQANSAFRRVEQVRLEIIDGDRLTPTRGCLYFLTESDPIADAEREVWAGLDGPMARVFSEHGIAYTPLVHHDVSSMTAVRYRRTVPVRCHFIGNARFP